MHWWCLSAAAIFFHGLICAAFTMTNNVVKPRIFRDLVIIGSGKEKIISFITTDRHSLFVTFRSIRMHCSVRFSLLATVGKIFLYHMRYMMIYRRLISLMQCRIYAGRGLLNPLVISGYNAGGQLMLTSDVENFPGYPAGKSGPDMMDDLMHQAKRFGAEFWQTDCTGIDTNCRGPFYISTDNCTVVAKSVIVATGAESTWLNAIDEEKFKGSDLSTCATCDGYMCRDKEVVVVGGGDSAMEEASFLTRFAKRVNLIHRSDHFRASKVKQKKYV